jgi:hypothetical protein
MNILTPGKPLTEEDLVRQVMERYRVAADFDRPFKDRCLQAWRNLHNQLPVVWPFWSEHFEPETLTNQTETCERIMGNLFPKENFFGITAMRGQTELSSEKLRELLGFNLRKKARYKLCKYRQVNEATSYGNGVVFHFVEMEVLNDWTRQPVHDEWGIQQGYREQSSQRVEFWSKERNISRFDCYPATTGADIEEMPYFLHRELVPIATLQNGMWEGVLQNVDKLDAFLSIDAQRGHAGVDSEDLAYDLYERLRSVGMNVKEGIQVGTEGGAVQYVELLYETCAPAAPGLPPRRRILGNRKTLLFDGDLPAWHAKKGYSEIKYLERSAQLWQADGLPALMEPLQKKLNLRSNQASDAIVRNNNPTRIVDRNAGIEDLTLLDPWPGRVVLANNGPTAVTELNRPQAGNDLFADLDLTRASIQRIAKLYDATRNIAGARSGVGRAAQTAGGAKIISDMMNSAVNFKMMLFEEQGIVEGLRIHLSLLQQVCTREQKLRVMDASNPIFANANAVADGTITISPEEVQGEYDVELTGPTETVDDPQQAEILAGWAGQGAQDPEIRPMLKMVELWLTVGERLGVKNPRQFLLSQQELAQKQAQQAQGPQPNVKIIETMTYKDLPADIQRQMEAAAGFTPSAIGGASKLEEKIVDHAARPAPAPAGARP